MEEEEKEKKAVKILHKKENTTTILLDWLLPLELLDREEERGEGEDGKEATAKILSKEEKKTILSMTELLQR